MPIGKISVSQERSDSAAAIRDRRAFRFGDVTGLSPCRSVTCYRSGDAGGDGALRRLPCFCRAVGLLRFLPSAWTSAGDGARRAGGMGRLRHAEVSAFLGSKIYVWMGLKFIF